MNKCSYCGYESADRAVRCFECGSSFVPPAGEPAQLPEGWTRPARPILRVMTIAATYFWSRLILPFPKEQVPFSGWGDGAGDYFYNFELPYPSKYLMPLPSGSQAPLTKQRRAMPTGYSLCRTKLGSTLLCECLNRGITPISPLGPHSLMLARIKTSFPMRRIPSSSG